MAGMTAKQHRYFGLKAGRVEDVEPAAEGDEEGDVEMDDDS